MCPVGHTHKSKRMLHFSNSFRSFLRETADSNKISQILENYYFNMHRCHELAITTKEVNYLTFRNDGTISYLPAGREHKINDSGDWSREGRQNGRPSRVIRKVFTPKMLKLLKDADFEAFNNGYQAKCEADRRTFQLRPNGDIPDVYCERYEHGGGSLPGSCMNGDRDYVEWYRNFDVEILCLYDMENQLLCGRALVWKLPDGRTFMDRVYVSKDHYYEMYVEEARKRGWIYKVRYKSYDDKSDWTDGDNSFESYVRITPKSGRDICDDYYPYVDTFSYGDDNYISNNYRDCNPYQYGHTDGTREGDNNYECCVCGCSMREDDAYLVHRGRHEGEYVCEDHEIWVESTSERWTTRDDGRSIVNTVDGDWEHIDDCTEVNGDWYRTDSDDIAYVEDEEEYVLSDDAVYCERDGVYYHVNNCVEDYEGNWILKKEAYEVNGDYYHESVVNRVA